MHPKPGRKYRCKTSIMSLYAPMTLSRFSEDDRGHLLVAGIVRCRSFLFSGLREVIIELVPRNSFASASSPTIGTKVVNMSLTNKVQLVKNGKTPNHSGHPSVSSTLLQSGADTPRQSNTDNEIKLLLVDPSIGCSSCREYARIEIQ